MAFPRVFQACQAIGNSLSRRHIHSGMLYRNMLTEYMCLAMMSIPISIGGRMKLRNAQSDLRKNPDSPRVHGLRLSLNSSSAIIENRENSNDRVEPRSSSTVIDYKREGKQPDKSDAGFERLLDVAEAARLLRMHPRTLRTKARERIIPAVQIGRRWRFRASILNDWLGKLAS